MKSLYSILLSFVLITALLSPVSASAKQSDAKKVGKPAISVKVTDDSVTLTVKPTENAEGYYVYLKSSTDAAFRDAGVIKEDGTAKRTFTINNLKADNYKIRVRAFSGTTVSKNSKAKSFTIKEGSALSLWTDNAPLKKALTEYIKAVTDESSQYYIPVDRRIAVFDLDGTLFCETDPNYFDYTLLVYRVLEDEEYKDKASDFEKEVANKIVTLNETGVAASGLEVDHGKAVASAFAGMTLDEFNSYIQEFKKLDMPSYTGMKRGEGWYRPMLQVIELLKANDFTVYVVSGTDRILVRGIVYDSLLDLPMGQIIGSDELLVASNQNGADGLNYVYTSDDKLVTAGEFIIKNLKMNKVTVIAQEIGLQPVLSFGNSTGDSSMAMYTITNNPYLSLAFMLCCDDLERENGNITKADKMYSLCNEFGWIPVSMKDDWKTIYGDGVTKITTDAEADAA